MNQYWVERANPYLKNCDLTIILNRGNNFALFRKPSSGRSFARYPDSEEPWKKLAHVFRHVNKNKNT